MSSLPINVLEDDGNKDASYRSHSDHEPHKGGVLLAEKTRYTTTGVTGVTVITVITVAVTVFQEEETARRPGSKSRNGKIVRMCMYVCVCVCLFA